MTNADARRLLQTGLAAAQDAVAVHRRHLGTVPAREWTAKGMADFVTHVDREAEDRIVARILAAFPDHGVLAEEAATGGTTRASGLARSSGWLWIIDPLDGTTNFLHRYPMYAASIAVACEGELIAGVVTDGARGDVWMAFRDGGAFRNDERIAVSETRELQHALIGTGFPFKTPARLPAYVEQLEKVLRRTAGVRRAGSAALDLCHVASGWFDGFWELSLAPWDVAAGALIIREAGGVVTRLDGSGDVIGGDGSVLAGNPHVYEALGVLVRGAVT
ncbi:MAG: inositol monophosphatase [Gemmatimonadetes bacterium]|nr:inositol monophosphatase [Gemmatimonadota bacterium]